MKKAILAACMALSSVSMAADDKRVNVDVQPVGPSRYLVRATFPMAVSPQQAQEILAPVGTQVCVELAPAWGHYKFETTEGPGSKDGASSTKYEQELQCGDAVATAKTGTPAPGTPPTEADKQDIEARTLAYLGMKDAGDFDGARAAFDPDVARESLGATWSESRSTFNRATGVAPKTRTVRAVTWYDDRPDAPRLGRYAAADYRADYADGAFYCGYVMWLRQADGSYRIMREDETIVTAAQWAVIKPEQRASLMQQPGCR